MVEGVGGYARLLLNLYQVFVEYSRGQEDDEVCSNSVYGLGVLAANALPDMARLGKNSLLLSPLPPTHRSVLPTCRSLCTCLFYILFLLHLSPLFIYLLSLIDSFLSLVYVHCCTPYSNYPAILQHLFAINQTTTNNRVKDNVTAAVCRMIMASQDSVPLGQVKPVVN